MTDDGENTGEIYEHLIRQKMGFNKVRPRLGNPEIVEKLAPDF